MNTKVKEQWIYEVWDIQTGQRAVKQVYKTRKAATIKAEKLNQAYGSHRYAVDYIQVKP